MKGNRVGNRYLYCLDLLDNLLLKLCGIAFATMVICIFFTILVRFIFSHLNTHIPSAWAEELARYLFIWSVFVAGGIGTRTGQLIGIDILVHVVPRRAGCTAKYIAHGVSMLFYVLLVVIGYGWIEFGSIEMSPIMNIPMSFVNASMIIGAILMLLNTVGLIIEVLISGGDIRYTSDTEEEIESLMNQYSNESHQEAAR